MEEFSANDRVNCQTDDNQNTFIEVELNKVYNDGEPNIKLSDEQKVNQLTKSFITSAYKDHHHETHDEALDCDVCKNEVLKLEDHSNSLTSSMKTSPKIKKRRSLLSRMFSFKI